MFHKSLISLLISIFVFFGLFVDASLPTEERIVIVKNLDAMIPLKPQKHDVALLQIGEIEPSAFYSALTSRDPEIPLFIYNEEDLTELQDYQTIIIGLLRMSPQGLDSALLTYMQELTKSHKVILMVFGSSYSLNLMPDFPAIILANEGGSDAQVSAAKVIFGEIQ